ncbi:uncharacterized protein LOC132745037 [Ruditapes philippinarum]|uniref:uncharacterized protein LOC132745037 n=1 Tax=Ruditapes philippinarum TaxID=129788 RepID=UPI00295B1EFC|nr:uncharacterized protein LOC132745037 [Ruditapes philippinarum]
MTKKPVSMVSLALCMETTNKNSKDQVVQSFQVCHHHNIFRIQDKNVRQTSPMEDKSSQPLRQIPQHSGTASRPVPVDRQPSTVLSVDARTEPVKHVLAPKVVPPRIGATFVPAGAADPAPYHFYSDDQFVDINQRGEIKINDTNSGEQILVVWLQNLDRKHTQEENNRTDIKEVVGQENRCRRFLDELEADIKLIINIHIKENHVVRKENKSTFYDILSAYLAIKTTLFFGPITSSGDCFRIEWDFNWPVGFDCEDTLYYCRVVLDQNGVIKTAYPIKYSQMCNM